MPTGPKGQKRPADVVGMREVAPAQFRTRVAAELLDQES